MKKMLAVQITALLLVSGFLAGMFVATDVYTEVQSRIVLVLCLSCIKLQPKTVSDFTFETVDNVSHPHFIIENLSKGPIFIDYSEDVCAACEQMYPIVAQLFNVSYGKQEMFHKLVRFENSNVTVIYINIDHTTKEQQDSRPIYDKDHVGGLPQFTIITFGYDHGIVKPYYTSVYGLLDVTFTNEQRYDFLKNIMEESVEMYGQNVAGFHQH